jgi:hypothetical protein
MMLWLSSLALALAAAQNPQDEGRPPVQLPPREDVDSMRPGFDPLHPVPQRPLGATPLRLSSNNLFHALFGFLPLESAETLEEGRFEIGLQEQISTGQLDVASSDYFFHYDATRAETSLILRLGIYADWEVGAKVDVSNLLEDEGDIILVRQGRVLVREGTRGTALGNFGLWTKKRLLSTGEQGAVSLLVGTKIPASQSKTDLLSSGGVDVAANLVWTEEFAPFTLHVNVGGMVAGKVRVFEEDVETRPVFTYGAAAVYTFAEWGALVGQIQGNQSVFKDSHDSIAILDKMVVTAHLGGRFRIGSYFLEVSAGTGLTDQSADLMIQVSLSLPL